ANAPSVDRLRDLLQTVQPGGVLAQHPLRRLHSRFGHIDRPLEAIHNALPRIDSLVGKLLGELQALACPADCWDTLGGLRQLVEYAESLSFLAEHDLLGVLVAKSDP